MGWWKHEPVTPAGADPIEFGRDVVLLPEAVTWEVVLEREVELIHAFSLVISDAGVATFTTDRGHVAFGVAAWISIRRADDE